VKKPSIQFYPGDWRKEPSVSCLSLAAKGLWWEMLLLMNEAPQRGFLKMPPEMLARVVGSTPREVKKLLAEMASAETYSIQDGCIVNRRMLRESGISVKRSEAGSNGAAKRWQKDSKTSTSAINLPLPRARVVVEDEVEVEKPDGGVGEGPIETIQAWLREYVGHFGKHWPPPDQAICFSVFRALNGASLDDLEKLFQDLYAKKQHPGKNYAWFVPVVAAKFEGRHGS